MRFSLLNGLILLAVGASSIREVAADFHINYCEISAGIGNQTTSYAQPITVSSNQYNCNGVWGGGIIYANLVWDGRGRPPNFFWTTNTCGRAINFYQSGNNYLGYINNGDGSVVASCYPSTGGKLSCSQAFEQAACSSLYVCNSSIC